VSVIKQISAAYLHYAAGSSFCSALFISLGLFYSVSLSPEFTEVTSENQMLFNEVERLLEEITGLQQTIESLNLKVRGCPSLLSAGRF